MPPLKGSSWLGGVFGRGGRAPGGSGRQGYGQRAMPVGLREDESVRQGTGTSTGSRAVPAPAELAETQKPQEVVLDAHWEIGGRYEVQRNLTVFRDKTLNKAVGELEPEDHIVVLQLDKRGGPREREVRGMVVAPGILCESGWVCLEGQRQVSINGAAPGFKPSSTRDAPPAIIRKKLEHSWQVRCRHMVRHPATLRADASLGSEWVSEVKPGQEVVLLQLGIANGKAPGGQQVPRLRARVCVDFEEGAARPVIGWLSPETIHGESLLDPVDLHGMSVVDLHCRSVKEARPRKSLVEVLDVGEDLSGVATELKKKGVNQLPWRVAGHYRVLEEQDIVKSPEDLSHSGRGIVAAASPGCVVVVGMLNFVSCEGLGSCPCAYVTLYDGPKKGNVGWLRCAAPDGRDLLDTRDQGAYDKIMEYLEAQKKKGSQVTPPQAQALLSELRLADIKGVFDIFDSKKTGRIGRAELKTALRKLDFTLDDKEAMALMTPFDPEGTGTVGYMAFRQIVVRLSNGSLQDEDDEEEEQEEYKRHRVPDIRVHHPQADGRPAAKTEGGDDDDDDSSDSSYEDDDDDDRATSAATSPTRSPPRRQRSQSPRPTDGEGAAQHARQEQRTATFGLRTEEPLASTGEAPQTVGQPDDVITIPVLTARQLKQASRESAESSADKQAKEMATKRLLDMEEGGGKFETATVDEGGADKDGGWNCLCSCSRRGAEGA
eukprot:TRINITY_DN12830_c0_g1_i1.p1 TRINITY_DN12830_c0_g1~~TRINITY_DN12830_c0_g1_i1.p1  ORF type:complete len:716 (+),score=164.05 TRINITY_DN12830_c0_g1_i1:123-2270(+)